MRPYFFLAFMRDDEAALDRASRFAALVLAQHAELRRISQTARGELLADPRQTTTVEGAWGVAHVVGAVHPAGGLRRLRDERDLRRPVDVATWLTRSIWGHYVAFIEGEDDVAALRDPSGGAPLHVVRGDRIAVAGAPLGPRETAAAGCAATPDLGSVAHVLARPPAVAHLQLLEHVLPVGPGQAISLGSGERSTVWSPVLTAARHRDVAPGELVATLDATVSALAPNGRIGVELSGGLDSSIVFASLAASGRHCVPFNVATAAGGGDERAFARSMAERWGAPLAEYEAGRDLPDYRPLEAAHAGLSPILQGLDSVFAGARQAMISDHGVDAVLTGQGGDSLFFQMPTRLVAADRLRTIGLRALSPRLLIDDAIRVQGSVWSVAATALGHRMEEDQRHLPALAPHLMGADGRRLADLRASIHPWLQDADKLPPAKHRHLMTLVHAQLFHGARLFAPTVPLVHPLLAQPMLELLLPCPAHLLAQGPLDRGLARAAMAGRLSREVAERRSKGEASDHYARAVLHNLAWLRELLLDGALASAGLLDRAAIDAALDDQAICLGSDYRGFVVFAAVECWLRRWL